MKIHTINKNGSNIKCELKKRRNSKNIRMYVNHQGIVKVSLPYYTPYIFAKNFINSNLDWIEQKLNLFKLHKSTYYYLGKNIRLIKKVRANIQSFNYIANGTELIIETKNDLLTKDELYTEFLREKASDYIPKRVEEIANKYGFEYNSVKIKNLTSRWGSCSVKKNLSFNLKLMYFNYNVIDYVIVHELCHLKEMNHSIRFWKLVKDIIPEYKEYKQELKKSIH
jgi:predicted metal-dependent hydrolase